MSNCNTYEDCGLPREPHNHYPASYYRIRELWLELLSTHTGWELEGRYECSCGAVRFAQLPHLWEVVAAWADQNGVELPGSLK